jgi:Hint domain
LISGTSTAIDGYIGFAANQNIWSFSPTATPTQIEYYFIGVAEHEISEVMGRFSDIGSLPGNYSVMDLFLYSAPGTRDLATSGNGGGTTAYFLIDGGTHNLGTWNNVTGNGDLGDWTSGPAPGGNDAFNAASNPGVINALSPNDVTLMNVLGWTTTACFMPGTMIRTPNGEVVVETLKRGDLVLTTKGQVAPVSWVGRQTVSTRFTDPLRVLPIRIKAGALAENVPARDLLLSPDHAVLVDGAMIQAGALVNGTSIVREAKVPKIFIYYHVELDDHSLILAENTPAETFVDNVDRLAFDNWAEHQALYPDGKQIEELPYPRAKAHRQVPVEMRVRLAERAQAIGAAADVAAA